MFTVVISIFCTYFGGAVCGDLFSWKDTYIPGSQTASYIVGRFTLFDFSIPLLKIADANATLVRVLQ